MVRTLTLSLAIALGASLAASAESAAPTPEVGGEEGAAFSAAARTLSEQSFTRACEAFNAFLQRYPSSALAREAKVRRAMACTQAGRASSEMTRELKAAADGGPLDLARALANAWLVGRGERWMPNGDRAKLALDQLQAVAARRDGRAAQEARARLFALCFAEMESGYGDVQLLAARILDAGPSAAERDRALYLRGARTLHNEGTAKKAEKDLLGVGEGSSEWADDALFDLAQWREGRNEYEAALALYQRIVQRFSPATSNRRDSAEAHAADIVRPVLSVGSPYAENPGEKTRLQLSFRNVPSVRLTVFRTDPAKGAPERMLHGSTLERFGARGETVKTWTESLKVPSTYAHGTQEIALDLPAGTYGVEAAGAGQTSEATVLVTPYASVLKAGAGRAAVWTTEAWTGKAVPGATVVLYVRDSNTGTARRLEGVADASGLCLFDLGASRHDNLVAWSGKSGAWATATGYVGWYGDEAREQLAYVLTDRPLYKPGEKVGLKVFLRERAKGVTTPVGGATLQARVQDASGRDLDTRELKTNAFGTASWEIALGKKAQLGAYSVYLSFPGRSVNTDHGRFRVEEFKPPEYTVKVEPLGKPKPGEAAKVKVSASFYFGGPVANASGRAIVTARYWSHTWKPWGDSVLDDGDAFSGYDVEEDAYAPRPRYHHRGYYRPSYGLGAPRTLTFKTDASGSAILEIPPDPAARADHSLAVQVFVTDASRREVTGSGTINLSATPAFVDLRTDRLLYKPGEKVKVQLRAEDANGNAESPALLVRLLRLKEDGSTGEVLRKPVALAGGRGEVELDGDAIGAVRVQASLAEPADAPALASSDVWMTSDVRPIVPPHAGFLLLTDRAPLKAGGTVRALVVSPSADGHVLVSLEGDRLWSVQSLEVRGRARFAELPITGEMVPNVHLFAGRLEEAQFFQMQAPVRVSGGDSSLEVGVKLPSSAEPGAQVPISFALAGKGAAGAPAELAVSITDEALFAIEAPREDFLSFFGRRAQGHNVTTRVSLHERAFRPRPRPSEQPSARRDEPKDAPAPESLDDLASAGAAPPAPAAAPARASKMAAEEAAPMESERKEKRASADEDRSAGPGAADKPVKARTNFSSSAGWFPETKGQVGGPAALQATFPDSLTSWRVTAVAVTAGPHLGVGKATLRTEKPLMVRLQGPRFFTERDEVTLSAIVTSRLPRAAAVDVAFEAPGLKPLEGTAKRVEVLPGGEARVDLRWLVEEPGERRVKVTARGGGEADAMEWTLPAVVHGAAQRQAFSGRLSDSFSFKVNLPAKRNPGGTRLELTSSPSTLGVMLDALPYLAQYPYGCVEQTLSRFVPAAIAAKIVNRLGATSPRVPADLNDMVEAGLKRLYAFQHSDGGWGWWQHDSTNRWMSAYAVYGLWLGREAGLKVDEEVLRRGRAYLASHLGGALDRPDEHAFMVFALAATGGAPKPALNKAFARRTSLSNRGRALLALALQAQRDPRARIAVENLDDVVQAAKARADASVGEANTAWETSAAIEATAYTLMAVYRHDPGAPLVRPLTDFLVLRRNGGKWRTTRDSAFALYALADIAMKEEASASNGTITVLVNGREAGRAAYKRGGLEMDGPIVLADGAFRPGENVVEVRRDGKGTGYWAATWDVYNQDEDVKGVGGDVKIARRYTILGRPGGEKAASAMEYGMALESGERVRVELEITASKAVEFVMLEDLKPAGLEAVLQRSGPEVCGYSCAHAELRADRVAMFLTELSAGTRKLSYELRAEVPGKFHGLPARLEAMYAPEIQATSDEVRLEVRDAPEPGKGIAAGQ